MGQGYYLCTCKCGNVKKVATPSLVAKQSQSCGCATIELRRSKTKLEFREVKKPFVKQEKYE